MLLGHCRWCVRGLTWGVLRAKIHIRTYTYSVEHLRGTSCEASSVLEKQPKTGSLSRVRWVASRHLSTLAEAYRVRVTCCHRLGG